MSELLYLGLASLAASLPALFGERSVLRSVIVGFAAFQVCRGVVFILLTLTPWLSAFEVVFYISYLMSLAIGLLVVVTRVGLPRAQTLWKAPALLFASGALAIYSKTGLGVGERFHEDSIEVMFVSLIQLSQFEIPTEPKRGFLYPLALSILRGGEIAGFLSPWAFVILILACLNAVITISKSRDDSLASLGAILLVGVLFASTPIVRILFSYINSHIFVSLGIAMLVLAYLDLKTEASRRKSVTSIVFFGSLIMVLSRYEAVFLLIAVLPFLGSRAMQYCPDSFRELRRGLFGGLFFIALWAVVLATHNQDGFGLQLLASAVAAGVLGLAVLNARLFNLIPSLTTVILVLIFCSFAGYLSYNWEALPKFVMIVFLGTGGWGSLFLAYFTLSLIQVVGFKSLLSDLSLLTFILFQVVVLTKVLDGGGLVGDGFNDSTNRGLLALFAPMFLAFYEHAVGFVRTISREFFSRRTHFVERFSNRGEASQ